MLTRGAVEFDLILRGAGPVAKVLRKKFDRARIARLRNGARLPNLATAVMIRELTLGRIVEKWWLEPVKG